MTHTKDADFTLLNCDVTEGLRSLADESVHCVVTSPPYWGLRDYGTGSWDGGDPECDHKQGRDGAGRADGIVDDRAQRNRDGAAALTRDTCKCGARRVDQQLGLETTPELYVARMVEVFREVRRVLRADGTCWLNLGDSYSSGDSEGHGTRIGAKQGTNRASAEGLDKTRPPQPPGLKPKDLVGIPWRVALALQADGWYLRSDIIWSKPNPMPESVTDRPTKAHEYVFLLAKGPRYFFDADAVREPFSGGTHSRGSQVPRETPKNAEPGSGIKNNTSMATAIWKQAAKPAPQVETLDGSEGETPRGPDGRRNTHVEACEGSAQHRDGERWPGTARNVRSVWEIATQPYPEAHFATYPEELVRRCILAGCPEDGTVLDPFLGSGTTAYVARKHGRRSIGIELNEAYCALAARRMQQQSLFAL